MSVVVCTCISLFNADRGRAVAATAIPFDIATGGEAEVCGEVNSYDFAEPCSAAINKALPLPQPMSMKVARGIIFCSSAAIISENALKRRLYHRAQIGEAAPNIRHAGNDPHPRARPKFDHRNQK
jgi:hypothetical protein